MSLPSKRFSVEQANSMLPLVSAITRDLVDLSQDVSERQARVENLKTARDRSGNDPYTEELSHSERELEKDKQRLQEFAGELRALGVEPRCATEGLIDFPSELEGRIVYLCWKLGEAEVLYWHELDAGFQGRQRLTAVSLARGEDAGDLPAG